MNASDTSASDSERLAKAFTDLADTVRALRAPDGCPWDRAQTHQTLRPFLIEEAYEVLDVLDQIGNENDLKKPTIKAAFREELGDLLMQVMLHAEMTRQAGAFSVADVAEGLNAKLVSRHPHVFKNEKVGSADQALESWDAQKAREKAEAKARVGADTANTIDSSVFAGIPRALPALQKTAKVIDRVSKVGFQWPDLTGPLAKVDEELAELKVELKSKSSSARIESEIGDLLFSVCNIAHFAKISPEEALRGTLARFESRFRFVEKKLADQGKTPKESNLDEMDRYWNQAKAELKPTEPKPK